MIPSLEGLPIKAKEAPSPHEVRLAPLDTNPVFHSLGESDLQDIVDWGRKWLVDFNAGKTQIVLFGWSNNTGAIDWIYLLGLPCISVNLPHSSAWNTVAMSGLVNGCTSSCNLELISYKNRYTGLLVLHLLNLLKPWVIIKM